LLLKFKTAARLAPLDRAQKAALASIAVGCVVFALKFAAFYLTGSVALYSDALESTINVVAAAAAFVAIRVAAMPADADHPYGHHKAEYFSAVFEGVLVVLAAFLILREAYEGFLFPKPYDAPVLGLVVNGIASAINAVWGTLLLRWGKAWRSPALSADGRHVLNDTWTSLAVLAGFVLVAFTGWIVFDSLLAALVAINVLWSGWRMVREAAGGLMDKAPADDVVNGLKAVMATEAAGAIEAHDIRIRLAGRMTFVDFHLIVDGGMSVRDAHDICDRIESGLRAKIAGDAVITIHVEPEHKAKRDGLQILPSSP
jgi:cation diffusion facilitator family transporter